MNIFLNHGPILSIEINDSEGSIVQQNITNDAASYLFENVEFSPDLKLEDIFRLFDACPHLFQIYQRLHAGALCKDAQKSNPSDEFKTDLLYVELSRTWKFDSHQLCYKEVDDFILDGVGPSDFDENTESIDGSEQLTNYSLAFTPVRHIAHLPLRLANKVRVFEDDAYSRKYNQQIQTVHCTEMRLGAVIQGILRSVTWFGEPSEMETTAEKIYAMSESSVDWSEGISADDFIKELIAGADERACSMMFKSIGHIEAFTIYQSIDDIPDDQIAWQWLQMKFGSELEFRSDCLEMTGRDFRKAFKEAGENE